MKINARLLLAILLLSSVAPAVTITLRLEAPEVLDVLSSEQIALLEKLNRADRDYLSKLPRLAVPERWDLPELVYSPMPQEILWCAGCPKAIVVEQPTQVFGAYEFGRLIRWGPVSSGRERYPTPSGEFHLNWKSRGHRSTDNPAWYLEYYFNFHNTRGIAFHKYALPGHPASHACVRMLERDAAWLYQWGEGWTLSQDGRRVITPGTPVWIAGVYDFKAAPPWLQPETLMTPLILPSASD